MAYNGVGLLTARGSGTNGYVQRNYSHLLIRKQHNHFGSASSSASTSSHSSSNTTQLPRPPNPALLAREKKRQVEVQLTQLRLTLATQQPTLNTQQLDTLIDDRRQQLLAQLDAGVEVTAAAGEEGRAAAKQAENDRMRRAFGITDEYKAGRGFERLNAEEKEKRRVEREANGVKEEDGKRGEERKDGRSWLHHVDERRERERRQRRGEEDRRRGSSKRRPSRSRSDSKERRRIYRDVKKRRGGTTDERRSSRRRGHSPSISGAEGEVRVKRERNRSRRSRSSSRSSGNRTSSSSRSRSPARSGHSSRGKKRSRYSDDSRSRSPSPEYRRRRSSKRHSSSGSSSSSSSDRNPDRRRMRDERSPRRSSIGKAARPRHVSISRSPSPVVRVKVELEQDRQEVQQETRTSAEQQAEPVEAKQGEVAQQVSRSSSISPARRAADFARSAAPSRSISPTHQRRLREKEAERSEQAPTDEKNGEVEESKDEVEAVAGTVQPDTAAVDVSAPNVAANLVGCTRTRRENITHQHQKRTKGRAAVA